jgi:hypothetical protein
MTLPRCQTTTIKMLTTLLPPKSGEARGRLQIDHFIEWGEDPIANASLLNLFSIYETK